MNFTVTDGNFAPPDLVQLTGSGTLPSAFDVTGLAVASMAAAGNAVAQLCGRLGSAVPQVSVDRALASAWFGLSFSPDGWELPPVWDSVAGDYPSADGWIRLHTNAPHHRAAALAVLALSPDAGRELVAQAVASWPGEELEAGIVASNGCAAVMRTGAEWLAHPQGAAVAAEPLVHWGPERRVPPFGRNDAGARRRVSPTKVPGATVPLAKVPGATMPLTSAPLTAVPTAARPLAGVRVLDLTRVIAGPVATRFLALYGAEVLRIDPPGWNEPGLEPEMTLGKHCARLDFTTPAGLNRLEELLAGADIFIHGYRPDAMDRLGLSDAALAERHPALVNVALDAYGWSGPWEHRRGFDSLVQMSCGIAHTGMGHFGRDRPFPLPVQALDHATGYLTAATALDAWRQRLDGTVRNARLSLARTAVELMRTGPSRDRGELPALDAHAREPENTAWGPGLRLPPAVVVDDVPAWTTVEARGYGSAEAAWLGDR